jgi:tetratricopeptide (TPR) repeat protein
MKADLYYKTGEFSKAYETFDKALILSNDDLTILNNYAYYLAEQNTNLKKAEEMALKVIEKEKNNDTFLDTYAWVLFKRGKTKDAAGIMSEILKRQSSNAEYFEHYGYILKELNNCGKAIEYWNMAIKADSSKSVLQREIENCK